MNALILAMTIIIGDPIYIEADAPDIVSKPANILDYYYYINGCYVDKNKFKKDPEKYFNIEKCIE